VLSPDEIRDLLRCLPDTVALGVLGELHHGRVYEAERLAMVSVDADAAHELVASIVRGTVTR
jgi:hypothetical protein